MNSKILTNEYKENIGDGTVMTYGSLNEKSCDIISINVRGKIRAIEKKKEYKEESKQLKENTIKRVNKAFENFDWINKHHIFTCDFTEKGIIYNKPFRFKYQVYVKPNTREPLSSYRGSILDVTAKINKIIDTECQEVGFEIIK